MIRVDCLVYGERERMHDLLASSLPVAEVPTELLRLTDSPPGYVPPGTRWNSLLGCVPVGSGWALWRVFPDPGASRAGMVQTHVRLLSFSAVAALRDLGPVLTSLPSKPQPSPEVRALEVDPSSSWNPTRALPHGYTRVAEALLRTDRSVVVSSDLPVEEMIRVLWRALWPEARRHITCQPGFGPESVSKSMSPGSLVVTPAGLLVRWSGFPVIDGGEGPSPFAEEGVRLLCGEAPEPVAWFMNQLERLPADLQAVRTIVDAAAAYQRLRDRQPEPFDESSLMRKVALLAPDPGVATALKTELVALACAAMGDWDAKQIGAFANMKLEAFEKAEALLSARVVAWMERQLRTGHQQGLDGLLARATAREQSAWWSSSIWQGLAGWLQDLRGSEWSRAWSLITTSDAVAIELARHLPDSADDGLSATVPGELSPGIAEHLLQVSTQRAWSRLHGVLLGSLGLAPQEQVERQIGFPGDARPGLRAIAARSSAAVVDAAAESDSKVLEEVALERVVEEPALLRGMDPAVPGWRRLWLGSLGAGVRVWEAVPDWARHVRRVWELLLAGEPVESRLVEAISRAPGVHLLEVPGRAQLWHLLPSAVVPLLAASTARAWIESLPAGVPDVPEEPIRSMIPSRLGEAVLRPGSVAPAAVVFVAEHADERETLRWLYAIGAQTFRPHDAEQLGRIASGRRWKSFARVIRDTAEHRDRKDLLPAVYATRDLLPWYDDFFENFRGSQVPWTRDVFVSYAHADDRERETLRKHLSSLIKEGTIRLWDDRQLRSGEWEPQIDERLRRAHLVLLLVTADFLASSHCEREATVALERFDAGKCKVIPIILKECDWQPRLKKLMALPKDGRAILSWPNPEEGFADVARRLREWIVEG